MRILNFFILSLSFVASSWANESTWPARQCKVNSDKLSEIENLVKAVCSTEGAVHICDDTATIKKDGKILSQKKINSSLSHALKTVVTQNLNKNAEPTDAQVRMITEDGEIQSYNAATKEMRSLKLADILKKLSTTGKLSGPLAEWARTDQLSGRLPELLKQIKFSDDGQYLVLPQKNSENQTQISLREIFSPQGINERPIYKPALFPSQKSAQLSEEAPGLQPKKEKNLKPSPVSKFRPPLAPVFNKDLNRQGGWLAGLASVARNMREATNPWITRAMSTFQNAMRPFIPLPIFAPLEPQQLSNSSSAAGENNSVSSTSASASNARLVFEDSSKVSRANTKYLEESKISVEKILSDKIIAQWSQSSSVASPIQNLPDEEKLNRILNRTLQKINHHEAILQSMRMVEMNPLTKNGFSKMGFSQNPSKNFEASSTQRSFRVKNNRETNDRVSSARSKKSKRQIPTFSQAPLLFFESRRRRRFTTF